MWRADCRSQPAITVSSPTARIAVAAVRWVLLAVGAATFQNSALSWSADHRAHHADTDGSGDPHPVTRGAWFAHIGWLFRRRQASADVTGLSDQWAVRSIRLQHRCYPAVAVGVGLVLPAVIAAQWGDPWVGCSWPGSSVAPSCCRRRSCVNSLAHLVGSRRYDARSSAETACSPPWSPSVRAITASITGSPSTTATVLAGGTTT